MIGPRAQDDFMHMLRPASVGSGDLPWSGLLSGMLASGIWYWCADQVLLLSSSSWPGYCAEDPLRQDPH